jgi:hypothetical protein
MTEKLLLTQINEFLQTIYQEKSNIRWMILGIRENLFQLRRVDELSWKIFESIEKGEFEFTFSSFEK